MGGSLWSNTWLRANAEFIVSPMWLAGFGHPEDGKENNNNNNSHDNVYGAVIMTKVIVRVYPVHLMNVD